MIRIRQRSRYAIAMAAALCAGLLPMTPAHADPATLATIEKAVGVDAVPADYVLLADTSSSMQQGNKYSGLKDALRDFLAALAPTDQVTLVTFDSGTRVVYQGAVGTSPDAIVGNLPPTATGQATDIGAALAQAVVALERPNAPTIASVVLVTDGANNPPPGSTYKYVGGFAWHDLARRVSVLSKTSLRAYALPIAGASGASLLGKVFPNPTRLDAQSITSVTTLLQRPKDDATLVKVRSRLTDDLRQGVTVSWPPSAAHLATGVNQVEVKLTSTTKYLPLTVNGLAVTASGTGFTAQVSSAPVALAPGQSALVPVTITWSPGPRSLAYSKTVTGNTRLALTGSVSSPWSDTLGTDLGLTLAAGLHDTGQSGQASANVGQPALYFESGAAVILIAAIVLLALYRRPKLTDDLVVTVPGQPSALTIPLDGRGRSIVLGKAEAGGSALRLRMIRKGRAKQLSVRVEGSSKDLKMAANKPYMVASVGFTWAVSGPAAAAPPRPTPPAFPYSQWGQQPAPSPMPGPSGLSSMTPGAAFAYGTPATPVSPAPVPAVGMPSPSAPIPTQPSAPVTPAWMSGGNAPAPTSPAAPQGYWQTVAPPATAPPPTVPPAVVPPTILPPSVPDEIPVTEEEPAGRLEP